MTEPSTTSPGTLLLEDGDLAGLARTLSAFFAGQGEGWAVIDVRGITSELSVGGGMSEVTRWERALRGIERAPTTAVAVLGSRVRGRALEVALACDVRIASPDSRFSWREDEGIWPSTMMYRLVQLIGLSAARRFLLLDRPWDADRALTAGLVDRVGDDPLSTAEDLRSDLGRVRDLRVVRQLISEALTTSYDEVLGVHLAACDRFLRRKEAE